MKRYLGSLLFGLLAPGGLISTTGVAAELQGAGNLESNCSSWHRYALRAEKLLVLNNTWGSKKVWSNAWQQCIYASRNGADYGLPVGWSYDWLASNQGEQSAVKAYPEVIFGNKFGTDVSGARSAVGLPVKLGQLPTIRIEYAYRESGDVGRELNVAAESFLHESCDIKGPGNPDGDNRVYELMVWVQAGTKRPHGRALTIAVIDDITWDVFADPAKSASYIAFIAKNTMAEGSLSWDRFINWTRQNAPGLGLDEIQSHWCLGSIEFGSEIWWGKGEFLLEKFDISYSE